MRSGNRSFGRLVPVDEDLRCSPGFDGDGDSDRGSDSRKAPARRHSPAGGDAGVFVALRPVARRSLRGAAFADPDSRRADPPSAANPDNAESDPGDLSTMPARPEELLRHFRQAFAADPAAAFRDWFRAQEELRNETRDPEARALADDLWAFSAQLSFPAPVDRARFQHNLGVFFGTLGPASDLTRARSLFQNALAHFASDDDAGWRARTLHNFATALSNLGTTRLEMEESISRFDEALTWRTSEREIARGVTLHNRGIACRRLAELAPERALAALTESAASFQEAAEIRGRHDLAEGRATSLFQLGLTLERLTEGGTRPDAARAALQCFDEAAQLFQNAGKTHSARVSERHRDQWSAGGKPSSDPPPKGG